MAEPIDYSKTQRIILLIDLNPLLSFHNPISYLTAITAAAKRLLTFAPLSESLFSFKFFFSSLSPLRSASAINRLAGGQSAAASLSFNHPSQTLTSLTAALASLSVPADFEVNPPRASYVASSLHELIHDYAWESEIDDLTGTAYEFPRISSNLVLLFSPTPKSMSCLSEHMNLGVNSEILRDLEGFMVKFRELFCTVSNAFANRDIHFSWIDVRDGLVGGVDNMKLSKFEGSMLLENGIKSFGWGFCSTDSIVLGSALIPFGLIYPKIGVSLDFLKCTDSRKGHFGQLNLEILDVKGKPLGCKFCDLELLNLNILRRLRSDNVLSTLGFSDSQSEVCNGESIWCCFGEGVMNMQIKAIQRYDEGEKVEGRTSSWILVREVSGDSKKGSTKLGDDFFAYRGLDILSGENGENTQTDTMPLWNILLNFLYKEGCQAIVSLSSDGGQTSAGILKPLTAHLALLSVIDNDDVKEDDWNRSESKEARESECNTFVDTNDINGLSCSQTEASTSTNCEPLVHGKRKKNKKSFIQNLSWSSFCDAAFKCSDFDLVEVCLARQFESLKMLKFLICWMKQIKKGSSRWLTATHSSKSQQHMLPPLFSQVNLMEVGDASFSYSETAEVFFSNLPKRIEYCLRSGMNLHSFAERLVKSSIRVLFEKYESGDTAGRHIEKKNIATELMELLLRKPKEMKEKLECNNPTSEVSDFCSTSENVVREYELQVLLRMEVLRSDLSENIKDSSKKKLVKQICSLLEIIQYLVEGGIHGHVSLYDYVQQTIKIRYSHILEDVVNKIYTQMDLLPFGDEDEIQAHLFNSEDSNQSWREKQEGCEITTKSFNIQPSGLAVDADESSEGIREDEDEHEHVRKLSEARERREQAQRRFVSYSRMPDLQRVWAPRQLKAGPKGKPETNESKRKVMRKARYSVVCETPMTERKRPCSYDGDVGPTDSGNSSRIVSKALFKDS